MVFSMFKRVVFAGVLLALPVSSAFAQDSKSEDVPCVGPMCMFTPVYKLGTMMPDMSGKPDRPASPPPPPPAADPAAAPGSAAAQDASGRTQDASGQPAPADAAAAEPAKDETASASRTTHGPRTAARRSSSHRSASVSHRLPTVARDKVDATVTIAANDTEIGRVLRLASVVKAPPIRVIPAVASVDGCRQKPADFVVDTMSNPERRGPAIPLFTESLIILARKDIHDLDGLRGRQVSFGRSDGSSQRVARAVFHSLGIDAHEVPLDLDNALDALALGDLDAVALLMPRGFDRLARHDPQLHLLSLPERMIPPDGLRLSRVDPASYLGGSWSTLSLGVVTVDAVLSPSRNPQMQPIAQAVYAALDRRSSELAENGFDLIGGGGLTTMRSVAKDADPAQARAAADAGCRGRS